MWRTIGVPLSALLGIFLVAMEPASAQRGGPGLDKGRWEQLGATRIGGYGRDRDVINVGTRKGRFEKVVLSVASGRVYINSLQIVFGSGKDQLVRLNDNLRAGQRTRFIDLQGGNRGIKQIVVVGRASSGHAVVELFGDPAPKWELIGKQRVGTYGTNLDTIVVSTRQGPYTRIKLEAKRQDVYIVSVRVAYNNGKAQNFRVNQRVKKDQATRPLKLSGYNRGIEHVEIVYRGRRTSGQAGIIEILGEKARPTRPPAPPPPPPSQGRWEELGCQKFEPRSVGSGTNRDIIRVGRREGRFTAIRLRAKRNDINIRDLKVVYMNGQPDDIRVRSSLREGGVTRPLDLQGRRRAIKEIDLIYSTVWIPGLTKSPVVCVDGRQ